jgi:hypothetical protein
MTASVGNIKIEPVNVSWQIEEQWNVETVADVAKSLENKYFHIYSGANAKFHVWFNAGTGADPAPSGSTAIPVTIVANDSAATVATKTASAIDLNANFHASASDNVITITCDAAGEANAFADVDTGFTFTQCQEGGNLDLGYLDGDVEAKFEEKLLEITAHQAGLTPLAELRQGNTLEVTLTLKECDVAKLKQVFSSSAGGTYTPTLGTEVFGVGTSRQGTNTVIQARRLILHPVALASSNYTRDLCAWKAYPMPDTLVFSGENPQTLGITFKTYLDESKPEAIRQWCFGDWTQLVPVI